MMHPRFWQDPDLRALPTPARLLYAYLHTGPMAGPLGLYPLDLSAAQQDLGWHAVQWDAAARVLEDAGFLVCQSGWVCLPRALGRTLLLASKQAVSDAWRSLPPMPSDLKGVWRDTVTQACQTDNRYAVLLAARQRATLTTAPGPVLDAAEAAFAAAWADYPKRLGSNSRRDARRAWDRCVAAGVSPEDLHAGVRAYAAHCQATGKTGTELVMQAQRFFGPGAYYEQTWGLPARTRLSPEQQEHHNGSLHW